jgi:hypothetical protein
LRALCRLSSVERPKAKDTRLDRGDVRMWRPTGWIARALLVDCGSSKGFSADAVGLCAEMVGPG